MAVLSERDSGAEREVRPASEKEQQERLVEIDDVDIDGMVQLLSQKVRQVQADDDGTDGRRGCL